MESSRPNDKLKSLTISYSENLLPQQLRSSFDLFGIRQTGQNKDGLVRQKATVTEATTSLWEKEKGGRKKGAYVI